MYPKEREANKYQDRFGEDYFSDAAFARCYIHKNYSCKMHTHEFYELNIITKGSGRHYIADKNIPAVMGDVFVIPPDIPHSYFSESSIDIGHIILKKAFMNRYREELMQMPGYNLLFDIEPLFRRTSSKKLNCNSSISSSEKLIAEFDAIIKTEESGAYMYENVQILSFISRISTVFYQKIIKNPDPETDNNRELFKIMEYIKRNLDRKLTIAELAAYGNISAATLNRLFRSGLKLSPTSYIIKCRVDAARELMEQNTFSKAEVAQLCGFYDSAHLRKYLEKF